MGEDDLLVESPTHGHTGEPDEALLLDTANKPKNTLLNVTNAKTNSHGGLAPIV